MERAHHGTVGFCAPTPILASERLSTQARPKVHRRHETPYCAAHPPRRITAVTKDLQKALQSSLQSRISRIDITLPHGAKLGTEKREGEESVIARRVAGDRELARIVAGMFEKTGLAVRVVFETERERAAAVKLWGPLVECEIVCWDEKAASRKVKKQTGGGMGKVKKSGAAKARPAAAKGGFGKMEEVPAVEPDVYIVVGGGAAFMARVRPLAEGLGMDKLIIIANGNLGDEQMPVDISRFMEEEFEAVYHYKPNPHPKWSGGVLFRKFPDEWVLCRLTGLGMLQDLLTSAQKPTREEIAEALTKEESTPGNEILKKITNFVDLGGGS